MPESYPVGLVGEQHYRQNVERCRAGQAVILLREPGNPFDNKAIVVQTESGLTLGYIPKSSFLYDHVNEAGGGADAVIRSGGVGQAGFCQIVIEVTLNDDFLEVLSPVSIGDPDDDDDNDQKSDGVPHWKAAVVLLVILIVLVRCSTT